MTTWLPKVLLLLICPLVVNSIDFSVLPVPTPVLLGQNLLLNCVAIDTTGEGLTYYWEFNGQPVYSSLPQAQLFPNNSLFVPSVTADALGTYTCIVQYSGYPVSATRTPTVSVVKAYIEEFVFHPVSKHVQEGSGVTFECVTGRSAPPAITWWEKDGNQFHGGLRTNGTFGSVGAGGATQRSLRLQIAATSEAAGTYTCVALNNLTNQEIRSLPAELQVDLLPKFPQIIYSPPSNPISALSQPYALHCDVVGWPSPYIDWLKDGHELVNTSRVNILDNGTVEFTELRNNDAGVYMCNASNDLGSTVSYPINLTVASLDVQFLESPRDVITMAGREVTLPCTPPHSVPPAIIMWYKNGVRFLPRTGEFAVIQRTNGALLFTNVQISDKGSYFCVAVNEHAAPSTRTSRIANIIIEGSPIFVEPPVATRVVKGRMLTMTCHVDGIPLPEITWYKQGVPILAEGRISMREYDQILLISDANVGDQGLYSCQASNIHGQPVSPQVPVTIIVPPEILQSVESRAVPRGSDVLMRCVVWGQPRPIIVWFKDNEPLTLNARMNQTEEGLAIRQVVNQDFGLYRCQATNEGGMKSSQGTLLVQVPPLIVTPPVDQIVSESHQAIIQCDAAGVPDPIFTWSYNGTTTLPDGIKTTSDGRNLIINSATGDMSGFYTCQAQNAVGTDTEGMTLTVQVAPTIIGIEGETLVDQGRDLDLECRVTGVPQPQVNWYFQGLQLLESSDLRITKPQFNALRVRFMNREDEGVYRCEAINNIGQQTREVTINIRVVPLPPILRMVEPLSKTSVNMSWVPPNHDSSNDVTSYVIQYKQRVSLVYQTYRDNVPPYLRWYEVGNLQPATDYVFQIAAKNSVGTGVFSNPIGATTLETAPSEPRNLRLVSHNATSVRVMWEVPLQPNGDIRIYQVQYRRKFTDAGVTLNTGEYRSLEVTVPTIPLQYFTVTQLQPYNTYSFRVRAATIENDVTMWGAFTPELMVTTLQDAPLVAPGNVKARVLAPRDIQVSWDPIPTELTNGVLRGYVIQYKLDGDESPFRELETGLQGLYNHMANLTHLMPWQRYEIRVLGYTDGGRGQGSDPVFETTYPDTPGAPPDDVRVVSVTGSSIELTWNEVPWAYQNSEISGYLVQYQRIPDGEIISDFVGTPDTRQINLTDLWPYSRYQIRVQAYTTQLQGTGFGPFSEPITIMTEEGAPGPVESMSYEVGIYSVFLSWLPPKRPNGQIQSYIITYRVGSDGEALLHNVEDRSSNHAGNDKEPGEVNRQSRQVDGTDVVTAYNGSTMLETRDTSYNITGLEPDTGYYITVAAKNQGGISNLPVIVTITTLRGTSTVTSSSSVSPSPTLPSSPSVTTGSPMDVNTEEVGTTEATRGGLTTTEVTIIIGVLVAAVLIMIIITVLAFILCQKKDKKPKKKYFVPPDAFNRQAHDNFVSSNVLEMRDTDRPKTLTINGATESFTLTDEKYQRSTTGYDTATTGYDTSGIYAASSLNDPQGSVAKFSGISTAAHPGGASLGRSHSEGAGRPKPVRSNHTGYQQSFNIKVPQVIRPQVVPVRSRNANLSYDMTYSSMDDINATQIPENRLRRNNPHSSGHGIDNPAYESELYIPNMISTPSTPGVYSSPFQRGYPHYDPSSVYSEGNLSKHRINRMRGNTAAAIAAQRNRITSVYEDTESLINNESVVVYDERTAL